MNFIPSPLHPAVVHFPIVMIVLGAVVSVIAVFWRKGYVPAFAAALLALGALGAWVATETGESDGGLVENSPAQVETLLDAHEDWAKRTLTAAAIAAAIAVGAAALFRFPRAARGVAVAAALAAGIAAWTVYETGHRGGALVYRHGAGVDPSVAATGAETSSASQKSERHREDRD
ncbi:MAG: hypothetical protein HOP33_11830 [Verrucomicrobia bacterium]|nr:hypothetical protein [Verrucomicrobiota bacterium]